MYVSLAIFFNGPRCKFVCFCGLGLPSTRNPAIKILKTPLSRTYERTAENEQEKECHWMPLHAISWMPSRTGERMPLNCFGFFKRFITYLKLIFFSFKKFVFLVTWLYQSSRVVQQSGLSLGNTFKCLARHLSPANIFFFFRKEWENIWQHMFHFKLENGICFDGGNDSNKRGNLFATKRRAFLQINADTCGRAL